MSEIAPVFKIALANAERRWTYAHIWRCAGLHNRGNSEKP
jgi:hypothetical protein